MNEIAKIKQGSVKKRTPKMTIEKQIQAVSATLENMDLEDPTMVDSYLKLVMALDRLMSMKRKYIPTKDDRDIYVSLNIQENKTDE